MNINSLLGHKFDRLVMGVVFIFLVLTVLFGVSLINRLRLSPQIVAELHENVEIIQQTTTELQVSVSELSAFIDGTGISSNLGEINETLEEVNKQLEALEENIESQEIILEPTVGENKRPLHDEIFTSLAWITGIFSVIIAAIFGMTTVVWRKRVKRLRLNQTEQMR